MSAILNLERWDAIAGEGHCIDCLSRLRPPNRADQSASAGHSLIGVCLACNGRVIRDDESGTVSGIHWTYT